MKLDRYENLEISSDALEYKFLSVGPKGKIRKIIQFAISTNPGVYNLAFGNLMSDGSIDDLVVNNNKDRNKILATIVTVVYDFSNKYPDKWIFFSGSTPQRTRLYRMALTIYQNELAIDFEIIGILRDIDSFVYVPFQKGIDYFGFFVKRKKA